MSRLQMIRLLLASIGCGIASCARLAPAPPSSVPNPMTMIYTSLYTVVVTPSVTLTSSLTGPTASYQTIPAGSGPGTNGTLPGVPGSFNATAAARLGFSSCRSKCKLSNDPTLQLIATSWWHCDGPAVACFAKAMLDIQRNLNSPDCHLKDCFVPNLPAGIEGLRNLGREFWKAEQQKAADKTPLTVNDRFSPYMELLTNVAMQKSRFCRIDFDVIAHLAEIVAASQPYMSDYAPPAPATNTTASISPVAPVPPFTAPVAPITPSSIVSSQATPTIAPTSNAVAAPITPMANVTDTLATTIVSIPTVLPVAPTPSASDPAAPTPTDDGNVSSDTSSSTPTTPAQ